MNKDASGGQGLPCRGKVLAADEAICALAFRVKKVADDHIPALAVRAALSGEKTARVCDDGVEVWSFVKLGVDSTEVG